MSKKRTPSRSRSALPRHLLDELARAERLLDRHQLDEALQILQELDRRRPNQPDVLALLVNLTYDLGDTLGYEWAIYRLSRVDRNDPDVALGLAGAYMTWVRPALALRTFELFLKRWPDHPRSADARQTAVELRMHLLEEAADLDQFVEAGDEEKVIEMMAQHDEVRFFLEHAQFQKSKQAAERLLKRCPGFPPVLNNLAQVYGLEGDRQRAMDLSRQVLAIDADNIHALSNLTRLLFLSGDVEAAKAMRERLVASRAPALEAWTKKAEALSVLGDDEGVLALYEQAGRSEELTPFDAGPLFTHFVAVAYANIGQVKKARQLWREVSKQAASYPLSSGNLADLDRAPGERNGPWAFGMSTWIPSKWVREVIAALARAAERQNERELERIAQGFLKRHPELVTLAPHMLARGDPATLEFVVYLCTMAETPELMAVLKDFALGRRGSDALRMKAAQFLSDRGLLPSSVNRLWAAGEWRDLLLMNFEITNEATAPLTNPEAGELAEKALLALRKQDGKQAQDYLEAALMLEPDVPSLQNNLALAYEMQGWTGKAQALIREVHDRFPDYFMGLIGVARLEVAAGNLGAARSLLNEAAQHRRLHVTEYEALCRAEIDLAMADKNLETARSWLKMWEEVNPDNPSPDLAYQRARLFPKLLPAGKSSRRRL